MAHQLAEPLLVHADVARREVLRDQPAVPAVLWRVELEEVAPRLEHVLRQVLDRRRAADLRGERLGVAQHGAHVVVPRDRPEAAAVRLGVPVHGRLALQLVEHLPRLVVREQVVVEQVD
jgi:hypothetical protein